MSRQINVAIVGATGAVGREMLSTLESLELPVGEVRVFASPSSLGVSIPFRSRELVVQTVEPGCFKGVDVVLGATSASIARAYVPQAVSEGALVIDNSSAFRMDPKIPLVVPEVNADQIPRAKSGIVANPNCSTIQMVVALRPLQQAAGLDRVVVSSYQSTSGTGQKGMEALSREVLRLYKQSHLATSEEELEQAEQEDEASPYPHPIAFNAIPQIGDFLPDGSTTEERKMVLESRKILDQADLKVSATCVRVPWFACHALSVNVTLQKSLTLAEVRSLLENFPGVVVQDEPSESHYPMPFPLAGSDDVYVGRLRVDPSAPNAFNMWIVADNLRKGAALNAVQILEHWLKMDL
ncbi:MAG: aspartate-semialdehyde dehydrogenase [Myxococcota bacterium]